MRSRFLLGLVAFGTLLAALAAGCSNNAPTVGAGSGDDDVVVLEVDNRGPNQVVDPDFEPEIEVDEQEQDDESTELAEVVEPAAEPEPPANTEPAEEVAPEELAEPSGPKTFESGFEVTVDPGRPDPSTPVVISAKVSAETATLTYRVGFDEPTTVDMDVADGVASATVPGQDAGTLVRYRIDAVGSSAPDSEDSIEFHGYVVNDPSVNSPIPKIDWFIDPADFDDMITNHLLDNKLFSTTVAYDGEVYDNVMVRPRGGEYRRTNFPKQSFEFEFPKGHDFVAPEIVPYPIDQFAMGSQFGDWTMGREHASWSVFNQTTGYPVHSAQVQLTQNGDFYGVYRISEKLDSEWREAVGLDGGAFYKANGVGGWRAPINGWDVKKPKGATSEAIDAVGTRLRDEPAGPTKTEFLYKTFDIPNVINYMALTALVDHDDQTFQNFYVFHDTDGTGLYSLHPWDLDETFGPNTLCWEQPMADLACMQDPLFDSVFAVPELQAMYWQRVRTLVDWQLRDGWLEERHAALIDAVGTELSDKEVELWGRNPAYSMIEIFDDAVDVRRWVFDNEPRMVPAQPEQPAVAIGRVSFSGSRAGDIELFNAASGSPIDISGWSIEGIDATIPSGTVILPGKTVVLTKSVSEARLTLADKNTVVVEFGGNLDDAGETLRLLTATGVVVDEITR